MACALAGLPYPIFLFPSPSFSPDSSPKEFAWVDVVRDRRRLGDRARFYPAIHYDFLPIEPFAVKLYLLSNVGGRYVSSGKTERLAMRILDFSRHDAITPQWSFTVFSGHSAWDREKKSWIQAPWTEEGKITVGFRESFRALARGDDHYFLTASGKLYRLSSPGKGKQRTLETIWNEDNRPVVAFITDADCGKTYLFCAADEKVGGWPAIFELASGVRLKTYDPRLFRPGDRGPEPFRRLIGYVRVLETLGLIAKLPPRN